MTAITDTPAVDDPTGAHHLDGNLAATAAQTSDPELPLPGAFDDRRMAGEIADYALAKLRRYVDGSSEISSHFIELSVRLAEVYARLGSVALTNPEPAKLSEVSDAGAAQVQFALDEQESAIEQLPAQEPS